MLTLIVSTLGDRLGSEASQRLATAPSVLIGLATKRFRRQWPEPGPAAASATAT